ncbi:hypothetical protein QFZ29_000664 [Agromyces albus]|nr:hypothetical protein [Agromyces albus]
MLRHGVGAERERGLDPQELPPLGVPALGLLPLAEHVADTADHVDECEPERVGHRAEHLGRRLLAAALDLGEILRRDARGRRDLGEDALLLESLAAQHLAEHVPPQRLGRGRASGPRELDDLAHGTRVAVASAREQADPLRAERAGLSPDQRGS